MPQHTVEPDMDDFQTFMDSQDEPGAIVMLNLLKFRPVADYGDDLAKPSGLSGKQAYQQYAKGVLPLMLEVGGVPIWMGKARTSVIAPLGEEWDEVFLVAYPSRQCFVQMVSTLSYQSVMRHRTAALLDSRLIETCPKRLPTGLLKLASAGMKVRSWVFPRA